jgi:hypothetical protein
MMWVIHWWVKKNRRFNSDAMAAPLPDLSWELGDAKPLFLEY